MTNRLTKAEEEIMLILWKLKKATIRDALMVEIASDLNESVLNKIYSYDSIQYQKRNKIHSKI